jgi:glycosyltransferase involved in cell wall biosynthesis
VLTTAHGVAAWLDEAVSSTLGQTLPSGWDLEVVVGVDACQESLEVARRLASRDDRVRVAYFNKNVGTYVALNTIASRSTGDLLAVLDGDDRNEPGRLFRQVEAFLGDPNLDLLAGQHAKIDAAGNFTGLGPHSTEHPTLATMAWPLHSTWMIRRTTFLNLGGYKSLRCGADTDLWIAAVASGLNVRVLQGDPVTSYRARPGQLTDPSGPTGRASAVREQVQRQVSADLKAYRRHAKAVVRNAMQVSDIHSTLNAGPKVVALLPTIPRRVRSARLVLDNLLAQGVELVVLHLNGHGKVPDWAKRERVTAILNPPGTGPLVRWSRIPKCDYVLGVDDDLVYPKDYVSKMVRHLDLVGHGACVSMHASRWPPGCFNLDDREVIAFSSGSSGYTAVSYLGSGASGFHRRELERVERIADGVFKRLDDVWISAAVSRAGLRIYRPPSPRGWIGSYPEQNDGIFAEERKEGFVARKTAIAQARRLGGWSLHPPHESIV